MEKRKKKTKIYPEHNVADRYIREMEEQEVGEAEVNNKIVGKMTKLRTQ